MFFTMNSSDHTFKISYVFQFRGEQREMGTEFSGDYADLSKISGHSILAANYNTERCTGEKWIL